MLLSPLPIGPGRHPKRFPSAERSCRRAKAFLLIALGLGLWGCAPAAEPPIESVAPAPIVATVHGKPLLSERLHRELRHLARTAGALPQSDVEQLHLKRTVLNDLIDQQLVLEAAARKGIAPDQDAVDRALNALRAQYDEAPTAFDEVLAEGKLSAEELEARTRALLTVEQYFAAEVFSRLAVTEADLEAHYQVNPNAFTEPEQVRAAQIVVETNDAALGVLRELRRGTPFEEVARRFSVSPEGRRGGDLGFFQRGVMPPAFDTVCFALPVGQISEIVSSDYGFHLFKVLAKKPARRKSFLNSRAEIEQKLLRQMREEAQRDHLEQLRAGGVIQIDEAELARIAIGETPRRPL